MRYRSITGNCSYLTSRGIAMKRLLMSLQIKMSWKVFSTGITGIIYVYAVAVRCRIQVVVLLIYLCMHISSFVLFATHFPHFTHFLFYSFALLLICSLILSIYWFPDFLFYSYSFTPLRFCSFYSFAHSTHLLVLLIYPFALLLILLILSLPHLLFCSFYPFTVTPYATLDVYPNRF